MPDLETTHISIPRIFHVGFTLSAKFHNAFATEQTRPDTPGTGRNHEFYGDIQATENPSKKQCVLYIYTYSINGDGLPQLVQDFDQ